jgi:hypothetical protein
VNKTIEELTIDAKFADDMVAYYAAARDEHAAESQRNHLLYIEQLEKATRAHNALLAFHGASS